MAQIQGLAQDHGGFRHRWRCLRAVRGDRLGRFQALAGLVGFEVVRRESLCFAVACIFSATVVFPLVTIGWDRALPFKYVDTTMIESSAAQGAVVHTRFTVTNISKDCHGKVDRYFFDALGQSFYLGTQPVSYARLIAGEQGAFAKAWRVPVDAAVGEGVYVSYPEFWCNPMQALWPIEAPVQKAKITVTAAAEDDGLGPH